jgi:hypothetical protein
MGPRSLLVVFKTMRSLRLQYADLRQVAVAYPGILFGGGSTNSVKDRGQGSGGGSPLDRGFEDSCNFVLEISFHIVKSS